MIAVYKITNIKNGKAYIGISKHAAVSRWDRHVRDANKRKHLPLYAAILKYGPSSFSVETVDLVESWEEAQRQEIALIKKEETHISLGKGYNMTWGGDGSLGLHPSKETREKQRIASTGRRHTEESKRKIGEKHKGNTYGRLTKGKKLSVEHRRQIATRARGRKATEETRAKMSASQYGRRHSEETKDKIRAANTGRLFSDSHREKLSEIAKRRDCSHLFRPVEIRGVLYESRKQAAEVYGVSQATITRWVKEGVPHDR